MVRAERARLSIAFWKRQENIFSDSYVSQSVNGPWRKTWSYIYQYYIPTGNNAMTTKSSRVGILLRREDETCRTFIKRLDTKNALRKSIGGKQEDNALNNIYLVCQVQKFTKSF